jgi:hypothetical protein
MATPNGKLLSCAQTPSTRSNESSLPNYAGSASPYLDDLVDEESFQASKAELIIEKAALKHEKARLQKNSTCRWFEPTNEVITALESAGKIGEAKSKGGAKSNETFLRETTSKTTNANACSSTHVERRQIF